MKNFQKKRAKNKKKIRRVAAASSEDEAPRPESSPVRSCGSAHVDGLPSGSSGDVTVSIVQSFIEAFKRPLQQPLIASPPRLRITKDPNVADDDDIVPKRSARLAAKSKF